jgi:hypothetical protein
MSTSLKLLMSLLGVATVAIALVSSMAPASAQTVRYHHFYRGFSVPHQYAPHRYVPYRYAPYQYNWSGGQAYGSEDPRDPHNDR